MGEQINARDWTFEATPDPSGATPVWTEIAGVESFSLNPSDGEESTSTVTFASGGQDESQAMQRGASIQITGKRVTGATAGTFDAGQTVVDDLAALVGQASVGGVRFKHISETEWTKWDAWVSLSEQGGGTNDKTSWGCTFKRVGAATTEAAV